MKKSILILIFLIPLFSYSQLNTTVGVGYDTHGRAIYTWAVGYEIDIFNFQAEIRPSLSRSVFAHNYVGGSIGLNLLSPGDAYLTGLSVIPSLGYWYDLKSQDKVSLNKYYWSGAIRCIMMLKDKAGLFLEGMYINKSVQATCGIHYKFVKQ